MKFWKLKIHWQILIAMALGVGGGLLLQQADPGAHLGIAVEDAGGAAVVKAVEKEDAPGGIRVDDRIVEVGGTPVTSAEAYARALAGRNVGEVVTVVLE